ncbi:MAG: 23S rRNA (uracil(1939)-C(5))-methyltransferase RlmD [Candidatus Melainabacteria bacterium]|nr:23S rRNA (uracil(1939)-C(5))-methyltransferase RlmD [Candidatus Melainabacteria bacterium]
MKCKADAAKTLAKGDVVTTTIQSLGPGGEGVSKDFTLPIFVNRVASNELVEVELFDVRKGFARGKVVRIVNAAPERVEPICKLFKVCGGCQWQHLSYAAQLKAKESIVRQAIEHIGGLDGELVEPTVGTQEMFFYRNKVQFPVASSHQGSRIKAGYYKQDSHELVNVKHCPIQPEPLDRVLNAARHACEQQGISAYNERRRTGLLRHICARYSFEAKAVLVTLVVNVRSETLNCKQPWLERLKKVALEIMAHVPEVVGVCLNLNAEVGNRILGNTTICLDGQDYIVETLRTDRTDLPASLQQGLTFRISPASFFQVNPSQAVCLLETLLDVIPDKVNLLVDAFAGVGTMALWLACRAAKVIAVEQIAEAHADGRINAEINHIGNVEFRLGSVEDVFMQMIGQGCMPDVILLDPPRKGVSIEALVSACALRPTKIIYVSCNPVTLARDLKILEKNGYKTRTVKPIDMFPQTYHVETITVLEPCS